MLVLAGIMSLSVASAQQNNIHLPGRELTAKEAIREIEAQTDYRFVVKSSTLELERTVRLSQSSATVAEILHTLLEESGMTYLVDGMYIILPVEKEETVETGKLTGTVYDGSGTVAVAGATIEITGEQGLTATTDSQGHFSLDAVPAGNRIVKTISPDRQTSRYAEVQVNPGQTNTVSVTLSHQDFEPVTDGNTILTFDVNPIRTQPDRTKENAQMPADGTYAWVPLARTARSYQPKTAIKTNLLYWATTTPNVGLEFYLSPKWSLNTHFGYNSWAFGTDRGMKHWVVQPEARYWFCNTFERGFIGLHGIYGKFNIQDMDLPFTDTFVGKHYKGTAYGAGIAYGHHFPLGKRWGLELSVGAGYVYLEYDKFRCGACDEFEGREYKHYFGPTKASVSLVFMIN